MRTGIKFDSSHEEVISELNALLEAPYVEQVPIDFPTPAHLALWTSLPSGSGDEPAVRALMSIPDGTWWGLPIASFGPFVVTTSAVWCGQHIDERLDHFDLVAPWSSETEDAGEGLAALAQKEFGATHDMGGADGIQLVAAIGLVVRAVPLILKFLQSFPAGTLTDYAFLEFFIEGRTSCPLVTEKLWRFMEAVSYAFPIDWAGSSDEVPSDSTETTSPNAGYVYVLINPSMPDLVKVGKTNRDPRNRVAELSAATGVPTRFVLIYQKFFDDCSLAERQLHAMLDGNGYRTNANREFFSASTQQVIEAINQLPSSSLFGADDRRASAFPNTEVHAAEPNALIDALLTEALYHSAGLTKDGIKDDEKAFNCYLQAGRLGSSEGLRQAAYYYLWGVGTRKQVSVAVDLYRQAGQMGNARAWVDLAEHFTSVGSGDVSRDQLSNARACWRNFFELVSANSYVDEDHTLLDGLSNYLSFGAQFGFSTEYVTAFAPYREQLIVRTTAIYDGLERDFSPDVWRGSSLQKSIQAELDFLRRSVPTVGSAAPIHPKAYKLGRFVGALMRGR